MGLCISEKSRHPIRGLMLPSSDNKLVFVIWISNVCNIGLRRWFSKRFEEKIKNPKCQTQAFISLSPSVKLTRRACCGITQEQFKKISKLHIKVRSKGNNLSNKLD